MCCLLARLSHPRQPGLLRALQDNALLRSITAAATGRRALKYRLRGQHHYVEGLMEAGMHRWQALVNALVAAAASGEPGPGCVRPLLEAGGDVDGMSKWVGCTPLMAACPESDDTCTWLLRQSGALALAWRLWLATGRRLATGHEAT